MKKEQNLWGIVALIMALPLVATIVFAITVILIFKS